MIIDIYSQSGQQIIHLSKCSVLGLRVSVKQKIRSAGITEGAASDRHHHQSVTLIERYQLPLRNTIVVVNAAISCMIDFTRYQKFVSPTPPQINSAAACCLTPVTPQSTLSGCTPRMAGSSFQADTSGTGKRCLYIRRCEDFLVKWLTML